MVRETLYFDFDTSANFTVGDRKGVCGHITFVSGGDDTSSCKLKESTSHASWFIEPKIVLVMKLNSEMNIHQNERAVIVKFCNDIWMAIRVEELSFTKTTRVREILLFLNIHFWLNTFIIRQKLAAARSRSFGFEHRLREICLSVWNG